MFQVITKMALCTQIYTQSRFSKSVETRPCLVKHHYLTLRAIPFEILRDKNKNVWVAFVKKIKYMGGGGGCEKNVWGAYTKK